MFGKPRPGSIAWCHPPVRKASRKTLSRSLRPVRSLAAASVAGKPGERDATWTWLPQRCAGDGLAAALQAPKRLFEGHTNGIMT